MRRALVDIVKYYTEPRISPLVIEIRGLILVLLRHNSLLSVPKSSKIEQDGSMDTWSSYVSSRAGQQHILVICTNLIGTKYKNLLYPIRRKQ